MRRMLIAFAAAGMLVLGAAGPASAAPGWDIKQACGTSFGQLVSAGKSSGTAAHGNYAGGAAAFANPAILAAHGCSV